MKNTDLTEEDLLEHIADSINPKSSDDNWSRVLSFEVDPDVDMSEFEKACRDNHIDGGAYGERIIGAPGLPPRFSKTVWIFYDSARFTEEFRKKLDIVLQRKWR